MSKKLSKLLRQAIDAPGIRPAHREKLERAQKSILVTDPECRYCDGRGCWRCERRR